MTYYLIIDSQANIYLYCLYQSLSPYSLCLSACSYPTCLKSHQLFCHLPHPHLSPMSLYVFSDTQAYINEENWLTLLLWYLKTIFILLNCHHIDTSLFHPHPCSNKCNEICLYCNKLLTVRHILSARLRSSLGLYAKLFLCLTGWWYLLEQREGVKGLRYEQQVEEGQSYQVGSFSHLVNVQV